MIRRDVFFKVASFLAIGVGLGACIAGGGNKSSEKEWVYLFTGENLDQWDTYLGKPWDPTQNAFTGDSIGLNTDPLNVYSIVREDGQNVLRISGQVWGGISTKSSFENYHLQLQFKWGDKRWAPRDQTKRDSGLLYHAIGEQGAGSGFWLKSQEFQIQEGDCGDYWSVAGAMIDIPAVLVNDSIYQYSPGSDHHVFGGPDADTIKKLYCKKNPDAERPSGEWNTLDLYTFNGSSLHVVNGILTMRLENSRHMENGEEIPLSRGKIQLQSEAAEIFYRDIKIRSIDKIPDSF